MKIINYYDADNSKAYCYIKYKNNTFVGIATCHPDDKDFSSELTGSCIAEERAKIKYYQHIKNNEIKPKIESLLHLIKCIQNSKKYNEKSYEFTMMQRQMRFYKKQLDTVNNTIATIKQGLKTYINEKDKFYKALRKRKKENK